MENWTNQNQTDSLWPSLTQSKNNYSENDYVNKEGNCSSFFCIALSVSIACGLLALVIAIYLLYTMRRKKKVILVYIINLLITDVLQLSSMFVWVTVTSDLSGPHVAFGFIYAYGYLSSLGFMFCVAFERYLVIAHPLWCRFSQPLRMRVGVCVLIWLLPVIPFLIPDTKAFAIYVLIPIPFFIFFLLGALKALSAAIHLESSEKQQIIGILVLPIVLYCLIQLPFIVATLNTLSSFEFYDISFSLLVFSPLVSVILYVFIQKGVLDRLLASLCCCKLDTAQSPMVAVSGTVEQS